MSKRVILEPGVGRQDRDSRARNFAKSRIDAHAAPGIQYIVVGKDTVIFSFAGGWADIAARRPMRADTTMMIYSMTKTITAAAVLQLVEQEKLSLDEPVWKYLDHFPYGPGVTVRHLLSQTSGLPNPIPLKWVHLADEHPHFDERTALDAVLTKYYAPQFAPGKKYAYSNISYWLLGRAVEKAAGLSFEDYVRRNIFERLGLRAGEIDFTIPSKQNHAKGYLPKWSLFNILKPLFIDTKFVGGYEGDWLQVKDHYLNGPAYGGIVASASAIAVFLQDQVGDDSRLFGRDIKGLFFQQQKNNRGEPVETSLGWHLGSTDDLRYFFKEGGGGGFHSEMRIYPLRRIASVVIANNTLFKAGKFLNVIDREFLEQKRP